MTSIQQQIEKRAAEEATGCVGSSHGLGKLYAGPINRNGRCSDSGHELNTLEEIQDYLFEGGSIGIPNAGAGDYRAAFAAMGYEQCEVFEWSSSAGDWSFCVFDGQDWTPAFQSNRYPHHGFTYSVNRDWQFPTLQECQDFMGDQ